MLLRTQSLFYFLFKIKINLSSGRGSLVSGLGEVRRHVTLEVEVGELIALLELEKTSELLVSNDLATILLVLELVLTDVSVDLTSYLSASHLSALGLTKETGKLVGDKSGLNESRRSTVARLSLALLADLGSRLKITAHLALNVAELSTKSRHLGAYGLELCHEIGELAENRGGCLSRGLLSGSSSSLYHGGRGGSGRSLNNRCCGSLGRLRCGSLRSSRGSSLSCLCHYTLDRYIFLSHLTQYIY